MKEISLVVLLVLLSFESKGHLTTVAPPSPVATFSLNLPLNCEILMCLDENGIDVLEEGRSFPGSRDYRSSKVDQVDLIEILRDCFKVDFIATGSGNGVQDGVEYHYYGGDESIGLPMTYFYNQRRQPKERSNNCLIEPLIS